MNDDEEFSYGFEETGSTFFDNVFLVITGVVVADATPAVPETSTWATIIRGFAGMGFMAYRQKAKPALSAA